MYDHCVHVELNGERWSSPPLAPSRAGFVARDWARRSSPAGDLLPPETRDSIEVWSPDELRAAFLPTGNDARPWRLDARDARVGALSIPAEAKAIINIPNAITAAGYALGLWWLIGGPAWAALVSILADELDGRIARAMGTTSEFGSKFDWTTDVVLTAATLQKMRAPVWAILLTTIGQVALRDRGFRPTFGSARAALMLLQVVRTWMNRGLPQA
ncbi:hypothetical protein LCGC14_0754750 [marine sediment metagenome]|uniref:CDP-alcohol phosphatidyltransferase family protein n=1 Tax=marine sediment metagenome TaxID=412755 RepID=A0A0F9Q324_9ZZZZ